MPVKTRINHRRSQSKPLSEPSQQQNIDPRYSSSTTDSPQHSPCLKLRKYHHNACRTKLNIMLDRKVNKSLPTNSLKLKKKHRVSYFLMSEEYKRKMSQGFQIPEQEYKAKRKISWSEESQFVAFNKNKSCQQVKQAPRHKFSIDE